MQQATCAHSGADIGTSSGNIEISSAPTLSRRALVVSAGAAIIGAALPLRPSSWFTHFDAETWIERWYRAGHKLMSDPSGGLMLFQNMKMDESYAADLRAELGWPENRNAVRRLLALEFQPARAGAYSSFVRRSA